MSNIKTIKNVISILATMKEDFERIRDGELEPDHDSCQANINWCSTGISYLEHVLNDASVIERIQNTERILRLLKTDFEMLRDGDWEPDEHSCEASITQCITALHDIEQIKNSINNTNITTEP